MIKYAARHWAHPVCLYKARGLDAINNLHTWQIRRLPVLLMVEAGVPLDQVRGWMRLIKQDDARIKHEERDRKRSHAQGGK